ncbi:MAG: TerD family protein [Eubacterium sp.]|nr:TerD family protein [Eubacterium sp.]
MNEFDIRINVDRIIVGFGWDAFARQRSGGLLSGLLESRRRTDVDFDGAATLLDEMGQPIASDPSACCVYYDNLSMYGALIHTGDDQSGAKEGDDETMEIDLSRIPQEVCGIALTMDLFKDRNPALSVGRVQNVYVRLTEQESGEEICKYSFLGDGGSELAFVAGFLLRTPEGWIFRMDGRTIPDVDSTEELIIALRDLSIA